MIETFQFEDPKLNLLNISKKDIIDSLTLDDVKNFLEGLGITQIVMQPEKGIIICPTICHNPLHTACSMKLYWYQNHKIFHCYTECNENMTIFNLYQKVIYNNENIQVSEEEAVEYVKNIIKHIIVTAPSNPKKYDWDVEKYKFEKNIPVLPEYPLGVLDCFTHYYHINWLRDGITPAAMDKFKISYSLSQNKIVIPHFDINGRLIGIRARALDEEEIAECGKYRPIQIGNIIYTHPLQFNLYGIYEHKTGIQKRRSAIIAEGEKSVLLDDGFYGVYSNTVACCGSNFNKYHISLLTDILGVNEITIAFDKEYTDWHEPKAKKYREKLENLCKRYKNQATFSYIWDYDNVLQEKDSPFDRGKEIFEYLYKNRVKVR